ncbi:hypothetical protein BO78DRAFT_464565 [Aspergillus sclerotiicarbonarius CBS 121057]|uniref:Insecticidal crystal toxin domain-containing protein n=1 Tax=Aspergillus sclerotiicarbonarius (strain CBS 121057 / IBT 28362) TaxID=1448318 RepID=A0A319DV16_ASPSB|nr:hypothetical protein BO78DRAFT_464565 [Aspergillus sclerotiicarbonarius CBS 121057]
MSNKTYEYGELVVTLTTAFTAIWNDKGSGASRDGGFWHPITQGTLRPLGSMAIGNFNTLNGKRAALLIGAKSSSGTNPPVKAPTGYTLVWTDKGSGADADGSFWRPIAPSGYTSMGDVVQSADGQYAAESIWDDKKSKADADVSIWEVQPYTNGVDGSEFLPIVAGTFRANTNHENSPDLGYAVVPTLQVPKEFADFTEPAPPLTAGNIPSTGTTYTWTEQCAVTLPFTSFYDDTDARSLQLISNPFCTVSRSIVWYVEGSWVNGTAGEIRRSKTIRTGVTSEQSSEFAHSTGVELSAKTGVVTKLKVVLNYQFTYTTSSTNSEYREEEVTTEIVVPAYHASVMFSKRILIKGKRADGSAITGQVDFNANDDVYMRGVDL